MKAPFHQHSGLTSWTVRGNATLALPRKFRAVIPEAMKAPSSWRGLETCRMLFGGARTLVPLHDGVEAVEGCGEGVEGGGGEGGGGEGGGVGGGPRLVTFVA